MEDERKVVARSTKVNVKKLFDHESADAMRTAAHRKFNWLLIRLPVVPISFGGIKGAEVSLGP